MKMKNLNDIESLKKPSAIEQEEWNDYITWRKKLRKLKELSEEVRVTKPVDSTMIGVLVKLENMSEEERDGLVRSMKNLMQEGEEDELE